MHPNLLQKFIKIVNWFVVILIACLILAGLVIHFYFFPNINDYKQLIADKISEKTHLHADIGHIRVDWSQLHPRLTVSEIRLNNSDDQQVLLLKDTQATVSWLSIPQGKPQLSTLTLSEPELLVERLESGEIIVAGVSTSGSHKPSFGDWVIQQKQINIVNATITWQDHMRKAPPLTLTKLNLALENPRLLRLLNEHRIKLDFIPSTGATEPVSIKGKLYGETIDDILQDRNHINVQFKQLDLLAFKPWLDFPNRVKHAKGGAKLGLLFEKSKLQSVDANLAMKQLSFATNQMVKPLSISDLNGRLDWKHNKQQDTLRVNNVNATVEKVQLNRLSGLYQRDAEDNHEIIADLPELSLKPLQSIAQLFAKDSALHQYLTQLAPNGQLKTISITANTKAKAIKNFSFKTKFDQLSINAYEKIPGLTRVSGNIKATEKGGRLDLNGDQSTVDLKRIFRWPIDNNQLNAKLAWTITPKLTKLTIDQFKISNPDLTGQVKGEVRLEPGNPFINVNGQFEKLDITQVKKYLPKFLREKTLHWLDNAFLSGTGNNVKVVFNGSGKGFPFTDPGGIYNPKRGVFKVTSKIEDATVHYGRNWPDVTNASLDLKFEGPTLTLKNSTGRIGQAKITHADFEIPTLKTKDPHLLIQGKVNATAPQAIDFINNSPVQRVTQGFTDALETQGQGDLSLQLDIPLKRSKETVIEGFYTVANGRMQKTGIPTIAHINGTLRFTERVLEAKSIDAIAFDTPIIANIITAANKVIIIDANGIANPDLVNRFIPNSAQYLEGETPFNAQITIQKPSITIAIDSNLDGLASSLPPPFNLTRSESIQVKVIKKNTSKAPHAEETEWQVDVGKLLTATARSKEKDNHIALQSLTMVVDDRNTQDLSSKHAALLQTGVDADININHIDLSVWQSVSNNLLKGLADENSASYTPNYRVKANTLDFLGHRINDVTVNPASNKHYIALNSDEIKGQLSWDGTGLGKLIARLDYLEIPDKAPEQTSTPDALEANSQVEQDLMQLYPTIDLYSKSYHFDNKPMGELVLLAKPMHYYWSIEDFSLTNPDSKLEGNGTWYNIDHANETRLDFTWKIDNLGDALTRLGHPNAIKKGNGRMKGQLHWPGSPHQFDLLTLGGNINFKVKSGQILKVKPGVGRLLGLVSLQSLPRRLTLDFRDLFSEGFAFDKISSDLLIEKGVMQSDNFHMAGPAADVLIKGQTNLKTETQHLNVKVQPQISDSVSLAALAGGPLAGAVAFLAQKVLKDPLNKIISTQYEIIGTWDKPEEVKKPIETLDEQSILE